jgi:hypothetical protein
MHGGGYLALLVLGVLTVLADGQLLLRDGTACVAGGDTDPRRGRRVAGFVVVIFHLAMLGLVLVVVARWPTVPLTPMAVVPKLGLLLLLTAVGHVLTMAVLFRVRTPTPPATSPDGSAAAP